jgi:hypothetical protein
MSELTEHVRFYFQQHNEEIPQIALKGATPKELYEGRCIEKMLADIKQSIEKVRQERVSINRNVSCGACSQVARSSDVREFEQKILTFTGG